MSFFVFFLEKIPINCIMFALIESIILFYREIGVLMDEAFPFYRKMILMEWKNHDILDYSPTNTKFH
ncbi:cobyrinic acid a,c-diamide synthase [Oikeobacillus pervagus]|uniref:Cobyrinic acid a,c-diamide synthase n=1 Tax=Oikeobacillus pervagus TaxID=1325931 RepID=A0AAJ1T0S2_9BACI|nr:cobyrinic acid a,c-diamide synthase [Oikeobacillus pervagus]